MGVWDGCMCVCKYCELYFITFFQLNQRGSHENYFQTTFTNQEHRENYERELQDAACQQGNEKIMC